MVQYLPEILLLFLDAAEIVYGCSNLGYCIIPIPGIIEQSNHIVPPHHFMRSVRGIEPIVVLTAQK